MSLCHRALSASRVFASRLPRKGLSNHRLAAWRRNPRAERPRRPGATLACVVAAVNGSATGGALAAGDAGKPGAPEDAARATSCPEGEKEQGTPAGLSAGDRGRLLAAPAGTRPLPLTPCHPLPRLAVSDHVTCLRKGCGAIAGLGGAGEEYLTSATGRTDEDHCHSVCSVRTTGEAVSRLLMTKSQNQQECLRFQCLLFQC